MWMVEKIGMGNESEYEHPSNKNLLFVTKSNSITQLFRSPDTKYHINGNFYFKNCPPNTTLNSQMKSDHENMQICTGNKFTEVSNTFLISNFSRISKSPVNEPFTDRRIVNQV